MKSPAILARALVLLCPALLLASADSPSAFERVRSINRLVEAAEVPLEGWQVREWVLGAQRQMDLKPVAAAQIVRLEQTYYVAEKGTGRWLVGNRHHDKAGPAREVRCGQSFKSLDALLEAARYAGLPKPPEGFTVREVARLPHHPTRLASDGRGKSLFALCGSGDVWRIDLVGGGPPRPVLRGGDYLDLARGDVMTVGMTLDDQGRLYVVANQRPWRSFPVANEVTIYRTSKTVDGLPAAPEAWVRTTYPWGIGPYNHGVGHVATGPDGLLYAASGSRTDGNEPGNDDRYWKGGEHELTACVWRIDPAADEPRIAVHARGLRNPYGFCWDDRGRMVVTDNGPDADPSEELNVIEKGRHYGFPYKFSDWTKKPYAHTPDPPSGLEFTLPVANLGPDGGFKGKPLSTFDPHSSPSGIVYLGKDFPQEYRGGFLVARFGNLIERPEDVGFDLLHVRLKDGAGGRPEATVRTFLAPVARPVDLHLAGKGRVYVCEYSRQIENKGYSGMLPGRVLELAVSDAP